MTQQNAATWYSIRRKTAVAAAGAMSAAEIFIYGDIGESWWNESVSAAQFVKDIAAIDSAEITIRINSIGGSVPDGIAIYNAIKRHKATTTTVIDGMAASISSLIALAGDKVEMAENATMMIHAPWTYTAGNSAELRDAADLLDTWAQAMATSYASKTGKSVEDVMQLLTDGKDHWYTAAEAKDFGLVDNIITALPVSASAAGPVFDLSRFRNVPAALATASKPPQAPQATPAAGTPTQASTAPAPQGEGAYPVAAATPTPESEMPQSANPTAAHNTADIESIKAAAVAAESQRRSEIAAKFAAFGKNETMAKLMAECQNDTSISAAAAGEKLLAALAKDAQSVAGSVQTVADEIDKRRDAAVAALMVRAGTATAEQKQAVAHGNPYRGHTLLDLARASLQSAGINASGMDKMQIVAAAFTQSTSDFPVLLENVMHKTLQAAYGLQADTWSRFCAIGTVSDFRAHNRYRVGSLGNLEAINELGEFKNKTIPDGEKASVKAGTKGNIINLSRQAIINDDLGGFVGLAAMLGRAARRTVEADVYAALAANGGNGPMLGDGKPLFHADHGNIVSGGSSPTVAGFDAMRVLMAGQKDVNGNDFLDLRPAVWLGPMSLGGLARVVNGSEYDPDSANKLQRVNMVRGLLSDIVDTPRLSSSAHYMFASPSEAPVLEVSFLDGNETPYLELQNGFTVDGAQWKVRLDFGVSAVDYRGAVKNGGA